MAITLNGTTGITDVNGTAAAPAITGTDTDSGVYFGTNTVSLATGGTAAVTVDSSQNVNIGSSANYGGLLSVNRPQTSSIADLLTLRDSSAGTTFNLQTYADPTYGTSNRFNYDGGYLAFRRSGTEAMRIDSSGNVIVSKTTTAIGTVGTIIGTSGNITISNAASTSAADGIDIYSTGAAAYRFYVQMNGSINATSTSITAISDISLKENIRDLETGLTQILALQPRRFDWKEETQLGEKNVAGFIAQEVEQVLPELVYDYKYSDTETKKSVKMGDILPTLVKAIQEQQALITSLTDRIAALEAR